MNYISSEFDEKTVKSESSPYFLAITYFSSSFNSQIAITMSSNNFWSCILILIFYKGQFTNYVDTILAFFDHLPPYLCWHFLPYERWQKVNIFGLPTSPLLVNVVCERPLMARQNHLNDFNLGKKHRKKLFYAKVFAITCLHSLVV